MKKLLKFLGIKEEDMNSKAYCECGHETLQDPKSSIYEGGTFTSIRQTTWDLNAPVPLFLSSME